MPHANRRFCEVPRFRLAEHRILIIGNQIHREVLDSLVHNYGLEAVVTAREDRALELLRQEPQAYYLVLLDIEQPMMEEVKIASQIQEMKNRGEIPNIPVIALTTDDSEATVRQIIAAQIEDVILKHLHRPEWDKFVLRRLSRWLIPVEKEVAA